MRFKSLIIWLLFVVMSVFAPVLAVDLDDKPFAEHYIILQVSDADPAKYSATLDISNNLIKHYHSPDLIDIEVIAFGKGVAMYFAEDNPNKARIDSLINNGVKFYVCLNTLDAMQRNTGKRPVLLEGVEGVQTGVAFMLQEIESGYTHIHP